MNIPDIFSGKIVIGPEPHVDQSVKTLDGDKPFVGTLAASGPAFIGKHAGGFAKGVLNVGTDLGGFSPGVKGRAAHIEGDVRVNGEKGPNHVYIDGNVFVTGTVDCLSTGRLEARHKVADSLPKPFDMVHPSKGEGHRLRYACIEGPEVGVYFRGRTQDNRQLWNEQDAIGDKISKSISHLVDTQMPLNWKQLTRLGLSIRPIDDKGRFDERGNQYEFGNELAGIAGLRRVEVNPEKSFNYKITDYKKGVRNSRGLFTSATLKGGVVTPEEIVDAYINANKALYRVNRELYQDIEAAKILGMSEDDIAVNMEGRGENRAFGFLNEGLFRPLRISNDVQGLFEIKAQELGIANPFEKAADVLGRIEEILSEVSLSGDLFPNIENPLKASLLPDTVAQANQLINQNPATTAMAAAPTTGFIGQGNVNIDPITRLTTAEEIYLDPTEKVVRRNQRTNTRLT